MMRLNLLALLLLGAAGQETAAPPVRDSAVEEAASNGAEDRLIGNLLKNVAKNIKNAKKPSQQLKPGVPTPATAACGDQIQKLGEKVQANFVRVGNGIGNLNERIDEIDAKLDTIIGLLTVDDDSDSDQNDGEGDGGNGDQMAG